MNNKKNISRTDPLIEDLLKLDFTNYLLADTFKRLCIRKGIYKDWSSFFPFVTDTGKINKKGENVNRKILISNFSNYIISKYETSSNSLGWFIFEILKDYIEWKQEKVDLTNIIEDLKLLNQPPLVAKSIEELMLSYTPKNKQLLNPNNMFQQERKKIFISHSKKDQPIVKAFVDRILILGLKFDKEKDIFCTSIHSSGVKSGEDFKLAIKDELINAKAVIQIITDNYKKSEVCLNEMGAAWVLCEIVIPLVLFSGNKYDIGFIHSNDQQLKLNNPNDLRKLYDDHNGKLFPSSISISNYEEQITEFMKLFRNPNENRNNMFPNMRDIY